MVGAAETSAPPEIAICGRSSPASGSNPWELFAATVSRPVTNIACYSVRRTARGLTEADRCRDGADRCRGRISCAIALKTL